MGCLGLPGASPVTFTYGVAKPKRQRQCVCTRLLAPAYTVPVTCLRRAIVSFGGIVMLVAVLGVRGNTSRAQMDSTGVRHGS